MQYIHHTPGRLRIKFPQLRNNPPLAKRTKAALHAIDGITSIEVSTVNGSLLIRYHATGGTQKMLDSIDAATREIGLISDSAVHACPHRRTGEAIARTLCQKMVGIAVEKCVERSATLLLGALL